MANERTTKRAGGQSPNDSLGRNPMHVWGIKMRPKELKEMAAALGIRYLKGMPVQNMIWQTFAEHLLSLPKVFGMTYRYVQRLEGKLPGTGVHFLLPDWLMRFSNKLITVAQLRPNPGTQTLVHLGHIEFQSHMAIKELGARLWRYQTQIHETWGLWVKLQQLVVDTADERHPGRYHAKIPLPPINNKKQFSARCVRPIECDGNRLSRKDRETVLGRIALLHFKDGARQENLGPIFMRIKAIRDPYERLQYLKFLMYNALTYERIGKIMDSRLRQAMEDGEMETLMTEAELRWLQRKRMALVDRTPPQWLEQSKQVKKIRREGRQEGMQKGRQEGMQKGRQEGMQKGRQEGMQKGMEKGLQKKHADGLIEILRQRNMPLSAANRQKLRRVPLEQLPPLRLALEVASAVEFANRTKLSNGHG